MSIIDLAWRKPGAKLGTCLVVLLLIAALPVWMAWWGWILPSGAQSEGASLLWFLGNALGTPLTAFVLFTGVVGLLGGIPRHHKVLIAVVVVLTLFFRLALLLLFRGS